MYSPSSPQNTPPPKKCVINAVCLPKISGDGRYHETAYTKHAAASKTLYRELRKSNGRAAYKASGMTIEIIVNCIQLLYSFLWLYFEYFKIVPAIAVSIFLVATNIA